MFQKSHAEANWPLPAIVGLSLLWVKLASPKLSWTITAVATNFILSAVVVVHAHSPLRETPDRLTRESKGFEELAKELKKLNSTLYAERYQLVAAMRFFGVSTFQWPGASRPSDYTLEKSYQKGQPVFSRSQNQNFWFVTSQVDLPNIPGYLPQDVRQYTYCADGNFFARKNHQGTAESACQNIVHTWYLARYEDATNLELPDSSAAERETRTPSPSAP